MIKAMGLTVLSSEVLDRLADAELTYREVGATAGDLPAGYHQISRSATIGHGRQVFSAASDAVRRWQVQRRAWLQVSASSPSVAANATLILGLGIGRLDSWRRAASSM